MVQVEAPGKDPDREPASWKKFHVTVAGRTGGAHEAIVERLRNSGHTEVSSPEDSDYLLVFCPVASRVGTDIGEALQITPAGKPVILVVMHHTFNPGHIIADSKRQVDDPSVCLTVDYFFYEGKLLTCKRNDDAWSEIQEFLGLPVFLHITRRWQDHWGKIGIFTLVGGTVIVLRIPAVATEIRRHSSISWCEKHRGKTISILVIILVGGTVIVPRIPAVVTEIRRHDSICQGFISWCKKHPMQSCILGVSAVTGLLLINQKLR